MSRYIVQYAEGDQPGFQIWDSHLREQAGFSADEEAADEEAADDLALELNVSHAQEVRKSVAGARHEMMLAASFLDDRRLPAAALEHVRTAKAMVEALPGGTEGRHDCLGLLESAVEVILEGIPELGSQRLSAAADALSRES